MARFWITKEMALEALKLTESMPNTTFIEIEGSSEIFHGKEYTVCTLIACGKKKTIKREFEKLQLANERFV